MVSEISEETLVVETDIGVVEGFTKLAMDVWFGFEDDICELIDVSENPPNVMFVIDSDIEEI